jgi:hypothetical protein
MRTRAKRGKTETLGLPVAARVAIWLHGCCRVGVQFAVSACERSIDSEAVCEPSPCAHNASSLINSGPSYVSPSCHLGSGTSGRGTKSR